MLTWLFISSVRNVASKTILETLSKLTFSLSNKLIDFSITKLSSDTPEIICWFLKSVSIIFWLLSRKTILTLQLIGKPFSIFKNIFSISIFSFSSISISAVQQGMKKILFQDV